MSQKEWVMTRLESQVHARLREAVSRYAGRNVRSSFSRPRREREMSISDFVERLMDQYDSRRRRRLETQKRRRKASREALLETRWELAPGE